MGTIHDLRLFQMGKETVHGTIVAATSKAAVELMDFEPEDEVYRPQIARGLILRNTGFETVVRRGTKFVIPSCPLNYEQFQNWQSMSVVGLTAPTGAGPYVWTTARNPAADPAPTSWSLERRMTDGSTPIDNKWGYALGSKLTVSGQDGKACMFALEGFARRVQAATLTPALSTPTIEIPPTALTKVFIDTTWAGLGGTQVSGQVLSWEVAFDTGLKPIYTCDGRSDLDFQSYVVDSKAVQISSKLICLVGGQYSTEKTAAEAGTLRAVRLQADGSSSRQLQIDFLAKHSKGSVFKIGEQDGQDIVEFDFEEATDGTNLISYKLTNNVATMT